MAVFSLLFIFSNNTFAQFEDFEGNANFKEGQIDVNVGLGLIPTFLGSGIGVRIPPVGASVEYAFTNEISGGAYLGISTSRNRNFSDITYRYAILGARAAYHFNLTEELDTYFGVMLGLTTVRTSYDSTIYPNFSPASNSIAYSFYGGARYPIADNLGLFGEIGYGISYITFGVALKI